MLKKIIFLKLGMQFHPLEVMVPQVISKYSNHFYFIGISGQKEFVFR